MVHGPMRKMGKEKKVNLILKIKDYLKETQAEMKKVVWPNRRYVTAAALIVLSIVVILGVLVMSMDFALGKIFGVLLKL